MVWFDTANIKPICEEISFKWEIAQAFKATS